MNISKRLNKKGDKTLKKENRDMLMVSDNIEELLQKMATYKAPEVGKWITKEKLT